MATLWRVDFLPSATKPNCSWSVLWMVDTTSFALSSNESCSCSNDALSVFHFCFCSLRWKRCCRRRLGRCFCCCVGCVLDWCCGFCWDGCCCRCGCFPICFFRRRRCRGPSLSSFLENDCCCCCHCCCRCCCCCCVRVFSPGCGSFSPILCIFCRAYRVLFVPSLGAVQVTPLAQRQASWQFPTSFCHQRVWLPVFSVLGYVCCQRVGRESSRLGG